MICLECKKQTHAIVGGRCLQCHKENPSLKKMGRPVTKTPEEREETEREWKKKNPRTEYFSKRYRGLKVYIVEHKGLFRRCRNEEEGVKRGWTTRKELADRKTIANARKCVSVIGCGKVVRGDV